jgi:hypothetical protein
VAQRDRRQHGQHRRHGRALSTNLFPEGPACGAICDVAAQWRSPESRPAGQRQLLTDLLAGGRTRLALAGERLAGLVHERLHLLRADIEDRGDLAMGVRTELGQQQRGALVLGQLAEVDEQLAQVLTPLDLLGQTLGGRLHVLEGDARAASAED